jgi:hypothetical protein
MKYFTPIHIEELNRKVYFNPSTFEPTVENLRRMANGTAPIGVDGQYVNLHHIGQRHTSNLAMLTDTFHKQYNDLIHRLPPPKSEQVNRSRFKRERRAIWMTVFDYVTNGFNF